MGCWYSPKILWVNLRLQAPGNVHILNVRIIIHMRACNQFVDWYRVQVQHVKYVSVDIANDYIWRM